MVWSSTRANAPGESAELSVKRYPTRPTVLSRRLQRVVDDADEDVGHHEALTPRRVEVGSRFGSDDFLLGTPRFLELCDAVAHRDQHVAVPGEGAPIGQRSMAGHDFDCRRHLG